MKEKKPSNLKEKRIVVFFSSVDQKLELVRISLNLLDQYLINQNKSNKVTCSILAW